MYTELLRPLTHPSDLATHPTLSTAYTDPALSDMVTSTEDKIREERNNLWRAKNLYRYFTGDESWIPCGNVESESDWDLFGPHPGFSGLMRKRRKLSEESESLINGLDGSEEDVTMLDGETPNENDQPEDEDEIVDDEQPAEVKKEEADDDEPQLTNGVGPDPDQDEKPNTPKDDINNDEVDDENSQPRSGSSSPPSAPPRRITRALAAEAETQSQQQNPSPPPTSPSPSLSSPPTSPSSFDPDPIFLLPPHLAARHAPHPTYFPLSFSLAHAGLPPDELRETRKLLGMFIQKSEETIRGLENILGKLIKAKRRRDKVFAWSIAEGHLGEMSDGEDWIDEEYWGLEKGELRKGRDEDGAVVVPVEIGAVAMDNENADASGNVVMGRSKNKRRRGAKD